MKNLMGFGHVSILHIHRDEKSTVIYFIYYNSLSVLELGRLYVFLNSKFNSIQFFFFDFFKKS